MRLTFKYILGPGISTTFLVLNPGTKNYLVIILFVTVQLYLPHHNPLFYPRAWSFPVLKGTFLKKKFKMSTCDMRHAT